MILSSFFIRLRQWYLNHFVPYITIQQSNEHFFISRQLWHVIDRDLSSDEKSDIRIFFKYVSDGGYYIMIVNPDMRAEFEEGVISEEAFAHQQSLAQRRKELSSKPRSVQIIEEVRRANELMKSPGSASDGSSHSFPTTFPLQLNPFGRIGFQGTQPSPSMIVYTYGLDEKVMRRFRRPIGFHDRIPLRVVPISYRPEAYGSRHAFIITDDVLHRPISAIVRTSKK